MDFIKFSISKPVTIIVGIFLVVLFGLIGLFRLPVQLTPDVETPQITVTTLWPGATPYEVEKDIIEEQEEVLKGIQRLTLMESSCYNSRGEVTLTFQVGADIDAALLQVSNKLNEVRSYPENVEKPVIEASGAQSSPIIWMVLKSTSGEPERINTQRTFFENEVRQFLDRVPGVGSLFVFGGSESQMEILVSPRKLANHRMTISEVSARLGSSNRNVSAGTLGVANKNYRVRTVSQYQEITDPLEVVLRDDGIRRVYLRDVATARIGYAPNDVAVMHNSMPVMVVGVRKAQGANVITLTQAVRREVTRLNDAVLADNSLRMEIVSEQTPYIHRAITLVQRNVLIGGVLAICVLLLFLRSVTSTLVTAIAIPISVIGTFIFMWVFRRSLNVVSLAGISFAVGMLVDNAIVVLENIDRHRNMGKSPWSASYDGAKEVWGAVLASTTTTVAVFLPIIFMAEEAGQLFKDIAIAITFAIMISLFVSVSAIPTLTHQFYRLSKGRKVHLKFITRVGNFFVKFLLLISGATLKNVFTRTATVILLTGASIGIALLLMPKAEYLPQGNRNLILNIMLPPPGYSVAKRRAMGETIYGSARPYFEPGYTDGIPQIENLFYVAADRLMLFGATSTRETEAVKMMPLFSRIMNAFPGVFGVSIQVGIFQSGLGRGRTIDVNIAGERIEGIIDAARMLFGTIRRKIPQAQVRPVPSLDNSYPEANFHVRRASAVANGLSEAEVGEYIDVLMDGRKVGEYKPEQMKKIDLVLRSAEQYIRTPEEISRSTIANGQGRLIPMGEVARLVYGQGMNQIDHQERKRNIKLEVTPPLELPLQQALETIEGEVLAPLQAAGKLDGVAVSLGGNADKLSQAISAIEVNLLLAAVIVYLLMSALFENFFYPLIIMFTVPLAAAGGLVGLRLVDALVAPQALDIVAMLGFIILVGTVVNNAILIVHQTLNNIRYSSMAGMTAITESVKTRIRPIYMSTFTSLFGMLPLVLSTGAGSELYRGLGSILLGGLAFSTLFTLFVIPCLLAFFVRFEKTRTHAS